MNEPDNYEAWINSLQVGDEVCYRTKFGKYVGLRIVSITKNRHITTNDGRTWRKGRYSVDKWESFELYPCTAEIKDEVMREQIIQKLDRFDYNLLSTEQLQGILKIIEGDRG